MHIGEDTIIAKCYLEEQNNEDNICYLSKEALIVKSKGILSDFPLDSIMNITFQKKILLMPIVFGGIIAPLSMMALFNGYYNVWVMLSLMMGGLALLYYGIEGSNTLSIQTNVKEYDYFIKSASPNLKSFTSFVVNYQHRGEDALIYYFALPNNEWQQALADGQIELTTPLQLSALKPKIHEGYQLLALDISKVSAEVGYTMNQQLNKLVPTIEKSISTAEIIIPNE